MAEVTQLGRPVALLAGPVDGCGRGRREGRGGSRDDRRLGGRPGRGFEGTGQLHRSSGEERNSLISRQHNFDERE